MKPRPTLYSLLLVIAACGTPVDLDGSIEVAESADVQTVEPDAESPPEDVADEPDTEPEPPPMSPCDQRCAVVAECGDAVLQACRATCEDSGIAECEDACVAEDTSCAAASQCFDVASPAGLEWSPGPYGAAYREVADDFTVPTLNGDWSFAANWTGHDSYVFAMTQTGFTPGEQLFSSEPFHLLSESPPNVHYFFMAYNNGDGVDDANAHMSALQTRLDYTLEKVAALRGKAEECHWRRRVHLVVVSAWGLDNWISQMLKVKPVMGLAIDRFQRIRPVGLLSLVQGTPLMKHLQYEAEYFNFEAAREAAAWTGETTTSVMYDAEKVNAANVDVELPSAAQIASFDTLEIDVRQHCDGHSDENCFEWDYKAYINVRERPVVEDNPHAEVACQPAVAQAEGVEVVEADTQPCDCIVPGQPEVRAAVHTCNGEGTGYGGCKCDQQWEIARWITTYRREGRWVMDASPFLPLLKEGGTTRFHFKGSYPYTTTVHLNFSNRGKPVRPATVTKLFTGGGFGPNYSDKYEPMALTAPAGTQRAEIVAFITGHGFGDETNCAEFCNHTHHFTVGGVEHMFDHPFLSDYYGCAAQVDQGTVPNQFGTWTIGRGGWCPGKDVPPFVADITEQLKSGAAELTYAGYLGGKPWKEGDKVFKGSIWMNSYLITYVAAP